MRKLDRVFVMAGLMSLTILLTVFSCDESPSVINEPKQKMDRRQVASALQTSHWNISYFFKNGDITDTFTGFSFMFQEDGTVQVVRNNVSLIGSWASFLSTQDQLKLNLEFQPIDSFKLLNTDWIIVQQTESVIQLEDKVNGQSMTLERI